MNTREDDWKKEVQRKFQERLRDYETTISGGHTFASADTEPPLSEKNVEKLKSKEMMDSVSEVNNFFKSYKMRQKDLSEKIQQLNEFNEQKQKIEVAMEEGWNQVKKLETLFGEVQQKCDVNYYGTRINIQKAKEAVTPFLPFSEMSAFINSRLEILNTELMEDTNKMKEIRAILSNTFADDLKNFSSKLDTCQICLESKITTCCNPCGHCFCSTCINQISRCALCRSTISTKVKLFLDNTTDTSDTTTGDATVDSFIGFDDRGIASLAYDISSLAQPIIPQVASTRSFDIRDITITSNF